MAKSYCFGCNSSTYRKSSGECMECGHKTEYMTIQRDIEPQPDPVMTFMVLSWDEYPDNETEVILKWFADGKHVLLGKLAPEAAAGYRSRIVVPTDKTKGMKHGALHKYISDRPFLYDKNAES